MVRCDRWLVLLGATLGSTGGVAFAAEEGGTPSIFAGDVFTSIWTLVVFLALLIVLRAFAWKPLLEALNKREESIRNDLESAKGDRERAQALLRDYEARLATAQAEAEKVIKGAAAAAERIREEMLDQAQKQSQETLTKALSQVEQAKREALRDIYRRSAELATELAARIMEREVNVEDHRVWIDEALADLDGKGRN